MFSNIRRYRSLALCCMLFNVASWFASAIVGDGGPNFPVSMRQFIPVPLLPLAVAAAADSIALLFGNPDRVDEAKAVFYFVTLSLPILLSHAICLVVLDRLGRPSARWLAIAMLASWIPYIVRLVWEQFRLGPSVLECVQAVPMLVLAVFIVCRLPEFSEAPRA